MRLVVVDLRLSTVLTMSGTRNRAATCAPAVDEQSHARHPRLRDALRWNCRPSSPPSFLSKDFPPLSDFETKNSLVQPRRGRRRSASRSWSPTSCGARPWRLGMGRREAGTGRRGGREEEQFFALAWPLSLSLSLFFALGCGRSGFTLFCFADSRYQLAAARRPLFPPPQFALLLPFFFRFKVYKREIPINLEPIVKVGMWQGRDARG